MVACLELDWGKKHGMVCVGVSTTSWRLLVERPHGWREDGGKADERCDVGT